MRSPIPGFRSFLLALGLFVLAGSLPVQAQTTVNVRFGEHAEYQRMVFDWPGPVGFRIEETAAGTLLIFDAPADLDLSAYERRAPSMIRGLTPGRVGENAAAQFQIPRNAEIKTSAWGNKVIVDVIKPAGALVWDDAPQATQQAAKPKPAPVPAPAPAPAAKPKPAPKPAKAAEQKKPEPVQSLNLAVEEPAEEAEQPKVVTERIVEKETEIRYVDSTRRFSVGANANTLGPGIEAGYLVNNFIGLRLGGNYFPGEFNVEADDVRYNADLAWLSTGALLDLYPFGGGFRITAGGRYNANRIELEARPRRNVVIGGQTFTPSEVGTIDGDIEYNKFAPYAGLGWEERWFGGRLGLALDLGVLYQGQAKVTANASGTLANDPTFQQSLDRETDEIEDDLSILSWYPVVGISLTYRF